jgi:hypothetical protein
MLAQSDSHVAVLQVPPHQVGHVAEHQVGVAQADRVEQALEVVRFEDEDGLIGRAAGDRTDHAVEFGQAMLAIEQFGHQVRPTHCVEFLGQIGIVIGNAEADLLARFALVGCLAELHYRRERRAVGALHRQVQSLRRLFPLRHLLQECLEVVRVVRGDHVQDRHAFDVGEVVVAEHVQIRLVRAHVHAFVDIGDRIARRIE